EADGEVVRLGRVEHADNDLGRFAERDHQHPARQRIERPAMADLGLGLTGLAQQALDRAYRRGRAHAERLVEDDPAVEHRAFYTGHSSCKIANKTVSRTWPVQVIRSARSTPSRTAPNLVIAAW